MMRTIEVQSELESLQIDQAIATARELERVTGAAPDGHLLAIAALPALRAGREAASRDRRGSRCSAPPLDALPGLWHHGLPG